MKLDRKYIRSLIDYKFEDNVVFAKSYAKDKIVNEMQAIEPALSIEDFIIKKNSNGGRQVLNYKEYDNKVCYDTIFIDKDIFERFIGITIYDSVKTSLKDLIEVV